MVDNLDTNEDLSVQNLFLKMKNDAQNKPEIL